MAERDYIIDGARVQFQGPFDLKGVSDLFREFGDDKHYNISERRHTERKTQEGQFHEYLMSFTKQLNDYARSEIEVRIQVSGAKERKITIGKKDKKIMVGNIRFVFDGILATDYEARWESKPVFFFIKSLYDKFVWVPYLSGYRTQIRAETTHLIENVKSLLNMHRF